MLCGIALSLFLSLTFTSLALSHTFRLSRLSFVGELFFLLIFLLSLQHLITNIHLVLSRFKCRKCSRVQSCKKHAVVLVPRSIDSCCHLTRRELVSGPSGCVSRLWHPRFREALIINGRVPRRAAPAGVFTPPVSSPRRVIHQRQQRAARGRAS